MIRSQRALDVQMAGIVRYLKRTRQRAYVRPERVSRDPASKFHHWPGFILIEHRPSSTVKVIA